MLVYLVLENVMNTEYQKVLFGHFYLRLTKLAVSLILAIAITCYWEISLGFGIDFILVTSVGYSHRICT